MPQRWTIAKPSGAVTLVIDDTPLPAKTFVDLDVFKRGATVHGDWVQSGDGWELETSIGKYVVTPGRPL